MLGSVDAHYGQFTASRARWKERRGEKRGIARGGRKRYVISAMQTTFSEILLGAALLAGCGGGVANLTTHEVTSDSDAAVAGDQPEAGPDPCDELAQYGDDLVATCSYYEKQCASQSRSNASSYRLSSPLFYYFPMFQSTVPKNFNGCLQEAARTSQLLGPLPYATFSDLYGDAKEYALRTIRRHDQRLLQPSSVDRSAAEGILALLNNTNLETDPAALEKILGADIFAAHRSHSGQKRTIFVYLDLHDNAGVQDAIARSVGELGKRGVTLVGAEGVFAEGVRLVADSSALQSFSHVHESGEASEVPVQDRACLQIAAGTNAQVFGVEDSRLWIAQRDAYAELLRARRSGSNGCEILHRLIHYQETTRWRSSAMAASLVQLMEERHEDAAVLIVGALHLIDLEEIFDRMDLNYVAIAHPATIDAVRTSVAQSSQRNETALGNFKDVCARPGHRVPVPLTSPATPAATLPAPLPTATLRPPTPLF